MKFPTLYAFAAALLLGAGTCGEVASAQTRSGLNPKAFQTQIDGKQTALYTLVNASGAEVCISNFGARIVSVMVPDRAGTLRDVVLGFDNLEGYRRASDIGATIGRVVNRIAGSRYVLDGDTVNLAQNGPGYCIHGGREGWDRKVWQVEATSDRSVTLRLDSPHRDEGFPGNVTTHVTYTLGDDNALDIRYQAVTDRPTVINLTNHSYFCLSGQPERGSTDDVLQIAAHNYTPADKNFITTGEIAPVAGTPLDFTTPKRIGDRIGEVSFDQLRYTGGYDQNWVLDTAGDVTRCAARLVSPLSGIVLEVYTNEPGIQLYTGNFLDGSIRGKGGIAYGKYAAVCLETQHYPDSPNKPQWPSVVVRAGETYISRCIFKFSVEQ